MLPRQYSTTDRVGIQGYYKAARPAKTHIGRLRKAAQKSSAGAKRSYGENSKLLWLLWAWKRSSGRTKRSYGRSRTSSDRAGTQTRR